MRLLRPGMVMTAAALLAKKPKRPQEDAKTALAGNLCRCGTHQRILRAMTRRRTDGRMSAPGAAKERSSRLRAIEGGRPRHLSRVLRPYGGRA